jgi:hypothetical protein
VQGRTLDDAFGKDHRHPQMLPGAWIKIAEIIPVPRI